MLRPVWNWEVPGYELKFDAEFIADTDYYYQIPVAFVSLFQESDRLVVKNSGKIYYNDRDYEYRYMYVAPRTVVLRRLDIMGISVHAARRAFEAFLADLHRKRTDVLSEMFGEGWLEQFSWDRWCSELDTELKVVSPIIGFIRGFFMETADHRLVIRALLEPKTYVHQVELNFTHLVHIKRLEKDVALCNLARKPSAVVRPIDEPVVILGEGSTDIRVLRLSLTADPILQLGLKVNTSST